MSWQQPDSQTRMDKWTGEKISLCPAPDCDSMEWENQGPQGFICKDCRTPIPARRVRAMLDGEGEFA